MRMKLKISEIFPSIQGEGPTVGRPSLFWRLSRCNVRCAWCDTKKLNDSGVWYENDEILQLWSDNRKWLDAGYQWVITGGEPLLQQAELLSLIEVVHSPRFRIEIETSGTIIPDPKLAGFVTQWNVSPKLGNSGVQIEKRLNLDALKVFSAYCNAIFKFATMGTDYEMTEINQLAIHANISPSDIYLMPLCSTRQEQEARGPQVAKKALTAGYNYSPRLHIYLWNQTTGV